jgi:hypothetical protein
MRALRALTISVPMAAASVATLLFTAVAAHANVALAPVSTDPFTDTQAQHRTEVEPDSFAFGSTIVAAFQVGRVFGGGASDVGFATSTNGGASWTHGQLPGLTTNTGGRYARASDASVAFDARHNVWLISSLGIGPGVDVVTSRSLDGGHTWSAPVATAPGSNDKNWIGCDNTSTSRFYGTCYTQYDNTASSDLLQMRTSTDGGLTWGPARAPGDSAHGLGGQPVVRPDGTVVVPYLSTNEQIRSFSSTNGGASWGASVLIAGIRDHAEAGNLRSEALPSAEIDAAGTTYVVWSDCRFRTGCPANDIVLSKSATGTSWSAPARIPIDATTSTVDHFVPGIGVDPASSGATARIGLTYYFYPTTNCTAATCRLHVGYISSANGGTSWSAPAQIAGPMNLSWIPNTSQGRMFGDYISTSVPAGGNAFPVIPVGHAPTGSTFDVAMYAPAGGLPVTGGTNRATEVAVTVEAPASTAVPKTMH